MRRFLTAAAVAIVFALACAGCNDYGNTFQSPTGATITFLTPADAIAGGPSFTLTLTASSLGQVGFVAQTIIQWNGKKIPTTFVNAVEVTGTVSAALIAKPGAATVNTLNPSTGSQDNGLSNPITFIINPPPNPLPTVSAISPTTIAAGNSAFTLTVTGTNFFTPTDSTNPLTGSQVQWNAGPTQTTMSNPTITPTQIQVQVPASLVANAGTAIVTVFNPPSPQTAPPGTIPTPTPGGGGTSAPGITFTITAAGSNTAAAKGVVEETPALSSDGRYVAFSSFQSGHSQVFVRDTCEGASSGCKLQTSLLSVATDGTSGNDDSRSPSMSSDGRYVAFSSAATNLADSAAPGRQIYLRDTCAGTTSGSCTPSTQLISIDAKGALVGAEGILPSISASGRFVGFLAVTPSHSAAKSKSAQSSGSGGDAVNSGFRQVFVRDTCLGVSNCTAKTTRISLQPGDASTVGATPAGPAISGNANHVAAPDAKSATIFTHSIAVDDSVFLALTGDQPK
jgi:hypothetical protein